MADINDAFDHSSEPKKIGTLLREESLDALKRLLSDGWKDDFLQPYNKPGFTPIMDICSAENRIGEKQAAEAVKLYLEKGGPVFSDVTDWEGASELMHIAYLHDKDLLPLYFEKGGTPNLNAMIFMTGRDERAWVHKELGDEGLRLYDAQLDTSGKDQIKEYPRHFRHDSGTFLRHFVGGDARPPSPS